MMKIARGGRSTEGIEELRRKSREGSTAQFSTAIAAMAHKARCSST
jgi:hypothetical protein